MKIYVKGRGSVTLSKSAFVAQGGEGDIYVRGDVAYKIFHDAKKALPLSKIRELGAIVDDRVIKPDAVLFKRRGGPAIGHAMPFVRDAEPLCRLFPRAFKERHGLDAPTMFALVDDLATRVRSVHAGGALIVDLNETNFLVHVRRRAVFAIDADSYQTASHPATAIMAAIQDPRTQTEPFDELSDWFSFAILSFQMLIGVHPFRGKHPQIKGLAARMAAGISVMHPDVKLPPVAYPLDLIPPRWTDWYRAVFEDGARSAPPSALIGSAAARPPSLTVAPPIASDPSQVTSRVLFELDRVVRGLFVVGDELCAVTEEGVFLGGKRIHGPVPADAVVGASPGGRPIVVWRENERLVVLNAREDVRLELAIEGDDVMAIRERIYVKQGGAILELVFRDVGASVIASARMVAKVLPHATRLFDGVAVQNLLGSTFVSLFPAAGMHVQIRVPELDGSTIVAAQADGTLATGIAFTVVLRDEAAEDAQLLFRVDGSRRRYDVTRRTLSAPGAASLAVLHTPAGPGLVVSLQSDGSLEVIPVAMGAAGRRDIRAGLSGGVHLAGHRGQLVCARHRRVEQLSSHGDNARKNQRQATQDGTHTSVR